MTESESQKESATHLRKLQFLLLSLLFISIAADLSRESSDLDKAIEQSLMIEDLLADWDPEWFQKRIAARPLLDTTERIQVKVSWGNTEVVMYSEKAESARPLPEPLRAFVLYPDGSQWYGSPIHIPAPMSLRSFFDLWDELDVDLPVYAEFEVIVGNPIVRPPNNYDPRSREKAEAELVSVEVDPSKHVVGRISPLHPVDVEAYSKAVEKPTHSLHGLWRGESEARVIHVYLRGKKVDSVDAQAILIEGQPNDWRSGPSERRFSELLALTEPYADLRIDQVRAILEAESERYSGSVELLGVKLPANSLTLWSIFAIAAVHCYLFLHLLRFAQTSASHDRIIDFPWIVLQRNRVETIASILILSVLPIVVTGIHVAAVFGFSSITLVTKLLAVGSAVLVAASSIGVVPVIVSIRQKIASAP